ncbi:hypothetical protein DRQ07_05110 [candidate division KSB1 bacterium]|nr:MAG: hypothetical protein DRQ07_05110 [candidate division KSB1 bacterium]
MKKFIFMILFLYPVFINAQQQEIDSLKTLLPSLDGTERIDAINKIAFDYYTIFPDSGIKYAEHALKLSKDIGYQKGIAKALQNKGVNIHRKGDLKIAYELYTKSLEIFNKLQDQIGICESYINLGLFYSNIGNNEKALDYIIKVIEIAEANNDTLRLIKGYINQSLILSNTEQYDEAIKLLNKAEELSIKTKDLLNLSIIYIDYGVMYANKNNIIESDKYYRKAEKICGKIGNVSALITVYLNLGVNNWKKGNKDFAIQYYENALKGSEKIGEKSRTSLIYYNLGSIYLVKNDYKSALAYFNKSLKLAEKTGAKRDLLYPYWGLHTYYKKINNCKNALKYLEKYNEISYEIYSEKGRNKIQALNIAYEVQKKDREMELLKKEKTLQNLRIQRQHLLLWLLITGFVIILIVANTILKMYKSQRKINSELEIANSKIKEDEKKLEKINKKQKKLLKELEELNLTKDKFFSIVAHDIKSPLQVQLSGARLLSDRINDMDKEKIREIALELKKNTMHLFDLLENLLSWSKLQQGRMEYKPVRIQLSDMLESIISLMEPGAVQKNIEIKTEVDKDIFIKADANMVKSVIQNLISNSIKFTNSGGYVSVKAKKTGDNVKIICEDNGVGIPENLLKDIFRLDKTSSRLGTEGEKGTGLGMVLCKEFVEKNKGEISIESTEGKGTKVVVILPAG